MLGFLVSGKQLLSITHENPRYVNLRELSSLLKKARGFFRVLHFNSQVPEYPHQIEQLLAKFGSEIEGIQLNLNNPSPIFIEQMINMQLSLEIIFQVRQRYVEYPTLFLEQYNSQELAQLGKCKYFLFDASQGKGIKGNIPQILASYQFFQSLPQLSRMNYAFAGGLSGGTLGEYLQNQTLKTFSFDAESQLRTKDNLRLDYLKVKDYLFNAYSLLKE